MSTPQVLILTGDAAESLEVMYPYQRLKEEGYEVHIAAPTKKKLHFVVDWPPVAKNGALPWVLFMFLSLAGSLLYEAISVVWMNLVPSPLKFISSPWPIRSWLRSSPWP